MSRAAPQKCWRTLLCLLAKRADLFNEAERLRDQTAEIKNDVAAIDRVLGSLGYTGDLDAEVRITLRQAGMANDDIEAFIASAKQNRH